jgi:putative nucleotidyltransferase with HDIG domain
MIMTGLESQELHGRRTYLLAIFGSAAVIVLVAAIRSVTAAQLPAIVVAAIGAAILDRFPIYLNPTGEIPLGGVIAIPTLVLFGWQAAVIGGTLALLPAFLIRSPRNLLILDLEGLTILAGAAMVASTFQIPGISREVGAAIVAAGAATFLRTVFAAARMHAEENISYPRALRYLCAATLFHHLVILIVAAVAVWTVESSTSILDRLFVPFLAAAVTLQLYLPRILRGEEQRRVLAAVSILAAAVDAKDAYTADHSASVAQLCRRVARVLGMNEPQAQQVYLGALLHDVGKTVVPPEILRKPASLTDEERRVVQTHVDAGVRIVQSIRGLAEAAPVVAASHERPDGRGYPRGLAGEAIPMASRIILAVDAYDALTSNRTYRRAISPADAVKELEAHAGTQFDPRIVAAIRDVTGVPRAAQAPSPARAPRRPPAWTALLRRPAFTLLWVGEMISFVGDQIFFVALTLWVLKLTGSVTMVAVTLVAATVGQGLLGLLAGAMVDRTDRRGVIIATDVGRALVVAILPFVLPRSLPLGFELLVVMNIGTVFFRAAVFALIPSIVPRADLATANALFQTTQRVAEIIGGVLGGLLIAAFGYAPVFYLDSASFAASAVCVAMIPIAWGAGLSTAPARNLRADIGEGLAYIWHTPLHRVMAWLAIAGYMTLAFDALLSPMAIKTAGLTAVAYGVINSVMGLGKMLTAVALTGTGTRWANVPFVVAMFLVTAFAVVLFGAAPLYPTLLAGAFLFGVGNIASNIANATVSLGNVPSALAGRLMATRQAIIAVSTLAGMLVFGHLGDVYGPPVALAALGLTSGMGVAAVWFTAGRALREPKQAPSDPRMAIPAGPDPAMK